MFALALTTLSLFPPGLRANVVPREEVGAIDHLLVLARHGERYPLFPVPELGDFVLGALTPNGDKTEKEFGCRLTTWYPKFFAGKPVAHMISPNESRCIGTAAAILAGASIEDHSEEFLRMIALDHDDLTTLLPLIDQANKTVLPSCVEDALRDAGPVFDTNLPENVTNILKLLFRYQLTDTIDTLTQAGYTGNAFGINIASCVPSGNKLMTEEAFAALTDLCRPAQCLGIIERIMDGLRIFAAENSPPRTISSSVSVYGLTDVHILDLLQSLLPQFNHTRPQFGGFIILEIRGDDATILTGQDVFSEPRERITLNIHEVIQLLHVRLNFVA